MKPFFNVVCGMLLVFVIYKHAKIKPEPTCGQVISNLTAGMTLGSASAFRKSFVCKNSINGQDLENYYRTSGSVLKKNPDEYFKVLVEYNIEGKELEKFLLATPAPTMNDIEKTMAADIENNIKEIKNRIQVTQEVRNSPLKPVALEILAKELTILNKQKASH